MASVEWVLICENVATTMAGGKNCLFGLFDRVGSSGLPATIPPMVVACEIVGNPGETIAARIELVGPPEAPPSGIAIDAHVPLGPAGRANHFVQLPILALPAFGLYAAKVTVGNQVKIRTLVVEQA